MGLRSRVFRLLNAALQRIDLRLEQSPGSLHLSADHQLELGARHAVATQVLAAATEGREFTFVQIGAHQAVGPSEPSILSQPFPRRGVLVEPQPRLAERLRARFAADPSITVVQCAVGESQKSVPFFVVDDSGGDLPEWTSQIASFKRGHLEGFEADVPGLSQRIRELQVDVQTPGLICDHAGITVLDLLMIDVEGWDWEVIRLFPFERVPVQTVVFEHGHLKRAERRAAVRRMVELGFRVQLLRGDAVAVRP